MESTNDEFPRNFIAQDFHRISFIGSFFVTFRWNKLNQAKIELMEKHAEKHEMRKLKYYDNVIE